jgi:hypothetical protein
MYVPRRDEWDAYMVVNIATGQWESISGDVSLCRKIEAYNPGTAKVIPIRIKRRRWGKSERRK